MRTKSKTKTKKTKKPYKIKTEKKVKEAAYRAAIKPEVAEEMYHKILCMIICEQRYKQKDYSAQQLAEDLGTNPRYLSAVINQRYGDNYSSLVNELRIRDAQYLLKTPKFRNMNMEEIGDYVGFSNRQSFYTAFYKYKGMSPRKFREENL